MKRTAYARVGPPEVSGCYLPTDSGRFNSAEGRGRRLSRTLRATVYAAEKIDRPGKRAAAPSSSSMRNSWLYFAMRSVREADPVLI